MSKIIEFYQAVLRFIKNDIDQADERVKLLKMAATCPKLRWRPTDKKLSTMHEDAYSDQPVDEFLMAAFKDLSTHRDPRAMQTYRELSDRLNLQGEREVVWARKVSKRKDGSAVIIVHVSNFDAFELALNRELVTMPDKQYPVSAGLFIGYS